MISGQPLIFNAQNYSTKDSIKKTFQKALTLRTGAISARSSRVSLNYQHSTSKPSVKSIDSPVSFERVIVKSTSDDTTDHLSKKLN